MTISSTSRIAGPFTGNGITTAFPFTFKVFQASDLQVVLTSTTGVETVETLTLNYTVALNANQDSSPGGTVTMLTAPASGELLTITSAIAETQGVTFTNNGGWYPTVINDALDKLTILIQQITGSISRSLKIPISVSGVSTDLPIPTASKVIGWNASGTGLANYSATDPALLVADVATLTDLASTATGKGAALVGFLQSGTGASPRTLHDKCSDIKSLRDFGAAGDGATDDKLAIKTALESGYVIDGGGLTYAINGSCTPTSMIGLQNAKFIQIGNNTSTNFNTLNIVGLSDIFIENVSVNMGSNITTNFADDANNGIYVAGTQSAGTTTYIKNVRISNVTVTGNGCGSGIHVRHAKRVLIDGCYVHDRIAGSSPDPTNDCQDGIQVTNCSNFELKACKIYNLQARILGVATNKFTRGILIAEGRDFLVSGCNVVAADQGYDFSGAYDATNSYTGNRRFTVSGCVSTNCFTYGFKFANVTRDGLVTGCIANNVGMIGFVFSPSAVALPLGLEKYNTQNILVVGCKVVNALGTSWAGANAEGFRIMANATYPDYPRGINLIGCEVSDTQDTPTTIYGFLSDTTVIGPASTGYDKPISNSAKWCTVNGLTGAGAAIQMQLPAGFYQGTGTIPATTSTWTNVDLGGAEIYDTSGLHSTVSNNNTIYIKEIGLYLVTAIVVFAFNATGDRKLRITVNGVAQSPEFNFAAHPSSYTTMTISSIAYVGTPGHGIAVDAWQNSGVALNINMALSSVAIARIQ